MLSDREAIGAERATGSREHDSSAGVISALCVLDQSLIMTKESAALSPMAGVGTLGVAHRDSDLWDLRSKSTQNSFGEGAD